MNFTNARTSPPPLPESARPAPWGPWATLAFTLLVLAVVFFAQSMVGALFLAFAWMADPSGNGVDLSREIGTNGFLLAVAGLVSAPVAVAAVWGCTALRSGIGPADYLGLRRFPVALSVAWLMVLGLYQVFIMMLAAAYQPPDNTTSEFMIDAFSSAGFKPLLWLSVVVFLPVSEELIFRGFMFRGLLHSRLGATGAVLLPALLWGGIHLQYDLFGILAIVGMGVVLGLARLATGSTWTTIAMHMAWNGLAAVSTELYLMNSG